MAGSKEMMDIKQLLNELILTEFALSPESLFAFYIAQRKKNALSVYALHENKISGVSISGEDYGLFEAYQCWVLAKNQEAFDSLLDYEIQARVHSYFAASFGFVESSRHKSELIISKDFFYILDFSNKVSLENPLPDEYKVLRVSDSNLRDFEISFEMKEKIGSFSDFVEGCNFWALILRNEIIGICDALVCYSSFASIQQVYICSKYRAKGLSKLMLASVISQLKENFSCLTYIVSEKNVPSIRLAESLGFKMKSELADIKLK